MQSIDIRNTTRGTLPRVPFEKIARAVLPRGYQLSLVFCGDTLARSINKKYRSKSYIPNVLSFEIAKNEGEIFINPRVAKREAQKFGTSFGKRLALLFVHGLFHLLGHDHGARMEKLEHKTLSRFGYAE